jgi:hypothetical protein
MADTLYSVLMMMVLVVVLVVLMCFILQTLTLSKLVFTVRGICNQKTNKQLSLESTELPCLMFARCCCTVWLVTVQALKFLLQRRGALTVVHPRRQFGCKHRHLVMPGPQPEDSSQGRLEAGSRGRVKPQFHRKLLTAMAEYMVQDYVKFRPHMTAALVRVHFHWSPHTLSMF